MQVYLQINVIPAVTLDGSGSYLVHGITHSSGSTVAEALAALNNALHVWAEINAPEAIPTHTVNLHRSTPASNSHYWVVGVGIYGTRLIFDGRYTAYGTLVSYQAQLLPGPVPDDALLVDVEPKP